jgi:hypothetical protein
VPESVNQLGEGGLVKQFESDVGFTHAMESKEHYPVSAGLIREKISPSP